MFITIIENLNKKLAYALCYVKKAMPKILFDFYKTRGNNVDMTIKTIVGTRLKTNNYLIQTEKVNILIDASCDVQAVIQALNGKILDAILLTHTHFDHVLKLEKFLNIYPNVSVYVSKLGRWKLENRQVQFVNPVFISKDNLFLIDDEIHFKIGDVEIYAKSTQGHTDCSVSYFVDNIIFTGDTVFKGTYGRCDLPTGDERKMEKSLKFLLSQDENFEIYPGHGEKTTVKDERKNCKM